MRGRGRLDDVEVRARAVLVHAVVRNVDREGRAAGIAIVAVAAAEPSRRAVAIAVGGAAEDGERDLPERRAARDRATDAILSVERARLVDGEEEAGGHDERRRERARERRQTRRGDRGEVGPERERREVRERPEIELAPFEHAEDGERPLPPSARVSKARPEDDDPDRHAQRKRARRDRIDEERNRLRPNASARRSGRTSARTTAPTTSAAPIAIDAAATVTPAASGAPCARIARATFATATHHASVPKIDERRQRSAPGPEQEWLAAGVVEVLAQRARALRLEKERAERDRDRHDERDGRQDPEIREIEGRVRGTMSPGAGARDARLDQRDESPCDCTAGEGEDDPA